MNFDRSTGIFVSATTILGLLNGLILFLPLESWSAFLGTVGTRGSNAFSHNQDRGAKLLGASDKTELKRESLNSFEEGQDRRGQDRNNIAYSDIDAELKKAVAETGEDSIEVANLYLARAESMVIPDQAEEAINDLERAIAIRRKLGKLDDLESGNLFFALANVYQESGDVSKALPLRKQARDIAERLNQQTSKLIAAGNLDLAEEICLLQKKCIPKTFVEWRISILKTLMEINFKRNNKRLTERSARQVISYAALHPVSNPKTKYVIAACVMYLARSLLQQKKYLEAEQYAKDACKRLEQLSGTDEREYLLRSKSLEAEALLELGRYDEYKLVLNELKESPEKLAKELANRLEKLAGRKKFASAK